MKSPFYLDQNGLAADTFAVADLIDAGDPLTEMRKERDRIITYHLAKGTPVTLTFNGKSVRTFYPDGSTMEHC